MRAMVFTKPGTVEMLDVPEPEVGPGDVIVEIAASGICGSELHGISDTEFRRPPLIMGHEFAGVTSDGRRVVANPLLSCGVCTNCLAAKDHLCVERRIVGIHLPGGFGERVAVPERALHELPDHVSFDIAAMIEPLANGVHALNLIAPKPSDRIAVLGSGAIGLACLLAARQFTDEVHVCDLSDERLAVAERLGAARTMNALDGNYDVIIDAVGAPITHRVSIEHLLPGGSTVWVGLLSSDSGIDGKAIVRDEKLITGSYCYTDADFRQAIALAEQVDLSWTTSFHLDRGAAIFDELRAGRHDIIKALLKPGKRED